MSKELSKIVGDFERRLAKLEAGSKVGQLNNASITGRTITVYDEDGETPRQTIGLHADGTVGTAAMNGPTPPVPTQPILTAGQLSLTATWDGGLLDADGDPTPAPVDVASGGYVQVHVSTSGGFIPDDSTLKGTLSVAGDLVVQPLNPVAQYVKFVTITTSGMASEPSQQNVVTPEEVTATDVVNTTIPASTSFTTPFVSATYLDVRGNPKARLTAVWTQPNNTDSTPITDGSHYEIRYSPSGEVGYGTTWNGAGGNTWGNLETWGQPQTFPDDDKWDYATSPWGTTSKVFQELGIGVEYVFQIRAVDKAANQGAWSNAWAQTAGADTVAPSIPAAPTVAGNRLGIQVFHTLGKAEGGTFNLESDLHHMEVHVGDSPTFFPTDATKVGTLPATFAMLQANIPAVGDFKVEETFIRYVRVMAVDIIGNRSAPSAAASVTAELVDDAHISDLTVTKLTAGTISARFLLGAAIRTADTGARVELNQFGFQAYDPDGNQTVDIDAATGNIELTGSIQSSNYAVDEDGTIHGYRLDSSTGQLLASSAVIGGSGWGINDSGIAALADLTVNDTDITIGGESLISTILERYPKGIVAYGTYASGDGPLTTAGSNTEIALLELQVSLVAGRMYKIASGTIAISAVGTTLPVWANVRIRENGSSSPTTSSNLLQRAGTQVGTTSVRSTSLRVEYVFQCVDGVSETFNILNPGTKRLLLTLQQIGANGTTQIKVDTATAADNPLTLYLEDMGPIVADTGVEQSAGGGGTTPVTTYTTTYPAIWSSSYNSSNSRVAIDGENQRQGYYSSSDGNQKSIIGFDYAQIQSDLAGATITKCEVYLYFNHWYYFAGGTAIIGTHDYAGTANNGPTTYPSGSVNTNRKQVSSWADDTGKWVDLGTTIGNEFKSGASLGIAMGPGPSNDQTYYGKYDGDNMTHEPQLRITYKK